MFIKHRPHKMLRATRAFSSNGSRIFVSTQQLDDMIKSEELEENLTILHTSKFGNIH